MTNECLLLRKEVKSLSIKLHREPNKCALRQTFSSCRKEYNRMRKKLRANYFYSLTAKVNSLNPKHSKSFWNAVKESRSQEKNMTTPISIDEWVNHCKSLLQMNGETFDKFAETETQFHNETPLDFPFTCK